MEESGGLKWWIVLCLFAAWAIVFLIVMKGIQSSGNVSDTLRCLLFFFSLYRIKIRRFWHIHFFLMKKCCLLF